MYAKGNTYVDGDLYVAGSIKVDSIKTSNPEAGNLDIPRLKDANESIKNRLLKFNSEDGELVSSKISETLSMRDNVQTPTGPVQVQVTNYTFVTDNSNSEVVIDTNSTESSPRDLVVNNVRGLSIETPVASINVGNSNATDANAELVPLTRIGTLLPDGTTASSPKGTLIFVDGNDRYIRTPEPTGDYAKGKGMPWIYPERFCYRKNMVKA